MNIHPDLHIRRATQADQPAVLELLRTSLGEGTIPRTPAYWRWKHEANPFGPSPVLVAEADGQVVGLRAFMRWTWQSGDRAVPAVRAVDTATHPDYQGRGIFKRLTLALRDEMEREGVAFVFNTPNARSRPGYLKMGWRLVGRPTLWIRPVRPLRLAAALYREGLGGEEEAPPPVEAESAGRVLSEPGVQELVESAPEHHAASYHTILTASYLRWRYAEIPDFQYYARALGEGAEGALLVMRSRRRGALRELRICDLVVGPAPAARRHARTLLRQAPRLAEVDVVIALSPGGSSGLLATAGYLPAPRTGPILTTYPFPAAAGLPDPGALASWNPAIGDLELF